MNFNNQPLFVMMDDNEYMEYLSVYTPSIKGYDVMTFNDLINCKDRKKYAQLIPMNSNTTYQYHFFSGKIMLVDDLLKDLFSQYLVNKPEVINQIITENGMLLKYVDKMYRTNEIMENAVTQNGFAIRYIDQSDRTRNIMIKAIRSNWRAIIFIDQEYRDIELMKICVSVNGLAIRNIDPKSRTDDLIMEAIKNNGLAIQYIDLVTRTRIKGLIDEAVKQNWLSIRYLKESSNYDENQYQSLIIMALEQSCCAQDHIDPQYFDESLKNIISKTARQINCPYHMTHIADHNKFEL